MSIDDLFYKNQILNHDDEPKAGVSIGIEDFLYGNQASTLDGRMGQNVNPHDMPEHMAIKKITFLRKELFLKTQSILDLEKNRIDDFKKMEETNRDLIQTKRDLMKYKLIQIPGELNSKENNSYEWLKKLIEEANVCFQFKAYTALGLLSRKILLNISFILSEKDEVLQEDKLQKNSTFSEIVNWLEKNNFLTKVLAENVNVLIRMKANELNHKLEIHTNEEEVESYMNSLKYVLSANFHSQVFLDNTNENVNLNNEQNENMNLNEKKEENEK